MTAVRVVMVYIAVGISACLAAISLFIAEMVEQSVGYPVQPFVEAISLVAIFFMSIHAIMETTPLLPWIGENLSQRVKDCSEKRKPYVVLEATRDPASALIDYLSYVGAWECIKPFIIATILLFICYVAFRYPVTFGGILLLLLINLFMFVWRSCKYIAEKMTEDLKE